MNLLFRYNWQVRDEWFEWCKQISEEELLKSRVGGMGSILHTLFHIVDVEYSWICDLQGKPEFEGRYDDYKTLEQVISLSDSFRPEVEGYLHKWTDDMEDLIVTVTNKDGKVSRFTHGEVLRHSIAHEIHHIGQLSVWAREIGLKPVSANLINRGLVHIK